MKNLLHLISWVIWCNLLNAQTLTNSNLPIIIINTENGVPIVDDPRVIAHMGVIDNGFGNTNNINDPFTNYDGRIEIEIRGSTSQQYPKKGYGFETQDALGNNLQAALLGMPPENDWILNGPYPDKTMIRNVLTYDLARKMGHYASNTRYCELIVNNDYRGIYILMERIKRDNGRVNIESLHTPNLWDDTLTGGYIVKVDKLTGEVGYSWTSNYNNEVVFQFHDPEFDEMHVSQVNYMEGLINEFESVMNSAQFADPINGYPKYIDRQSFQDFFILQELGRTVDGYRSSSFMHKDKNSLNWNSKLVAGPMWDFNLSYGNADYCDADITTGWQYNFDEICNFTTSIPFWWEKLLSDPAYANSLKCRWQELREGPLKTSTINNYIDSISNHLADARIRNFQKWPIIGVYVNWNGFVGQTYQEDLDFFKNYIAQRSIWMDNNLPGVCDLSVENVKEEPQYHIAWPNPNHTDQINIGFTLFEQDEIHIQVIDLTGRIHLQKRLETLEKGKNSVQLSTLDLAKGTYIYQISNANSVLYTGKIIQQ
jgi:hypothetical protein